MHYDFPSLLKFSENNPLLPPDWTQRPWGRPIISVPSGNDPNLLALIKIRYNGIIINGIKVMNVDNFLEVVMPAKKFNERIEPAIRFLDQHEQALFCSDILWMYRYIKTEKAKNNGQEKLSRVHENNRHSAPWA